MPTLLFLVTYLILFSPLYPSKGVFLLGVLNKPEHRCNSPFCKVQKLSISTEDFSDYSKLNF